MEYDVLIIGGGINGCAIAREAALNGWSVLLVEKDDLASHTSSASTKLIHGGLRYLESYEFRLVRKALHERKRLMDAAAHLIHPVQFVLPHENSVRPWWMVRAGLLLYDLLAGSANIGLSRMLRKRDRGFRFPLKSEAGGFAYWDCTVDDARLTIANAMDAERRGAVVMTRTAFVSATRDHRLWTAKLSTGATVEAKAIVNAAGPWLTGVENGLGQKPRTPLKLVKGSHVVLPSLFEGHHAYMLQQPDRRIVFAIPWVEGTTMIGTTEEVVATPENPAISEEERTYLLEAANHAFVRQSRLEDIRHDWAGVRPLVDDGAADARTLTRDYILEVDADGAPALSILGGKITTARALAEDAMLKLGKALGRHVDPVTRGRSFPGGHIPMEFAEFVERSREIWPFLGEERAERMSRAYGTDLARMLQGIESERDLGRDFGHGLTRLEVDWMIDREWARSAEDILWRRSKLGLSFTAAETAALEKYVKGRASAARH